MCAQETYGIFPCSTSLIGNIVLMAVWGYTLLQGADLLSDGSEMLLEVLNPGQLAVAAECRMAGASAWC